MQLPWILDIQACRAGIRPQLGHFLMAESGLAAPRCMPDQATVHIQHADQHGTIHPGHGMKRLGITNATYISESSAAP